jgi:hypothetical protein
MAGAAGVGVLAHMHPACSRAPAAADLDVAVIGGGVSGMYAAWRLCTQGGAAGPPPRVAVFELSERIGGRLYSVAVPDAPHLHAEMGGMRFLTSQQLVAGLVNHLGLPIKPFAVGGDNNLFYTRGKRFTVAQLAARSNAVPYDLPPALAGKPPFGLFASVADQYVTNRARLDGKGWLAAKQSAQALGRPLYDWDLVELLRKSLPRDAYEFVRDGLGYSLKSDLNHNAAELLEDFTGTIGNARVSRRVATCRRGRGWCCWSGRARAPPRRFD